MKKTGLVILLRTALLAGCTNEKGAGGVLDVAGAIVTAPIMFIEAQRNDRASFLKRGKDNHWPLPPIDAKLRRLAATTLDQALNQRALDKTVYWGTHADASGYAAGGGTVLATGRTQEGRPCREVLIETAIKERLTDQRGRTFCRERGRRGEVASEHP